MPRILAALALARALLASLPAHAETASWYGPGFHERLTASGKRFDASGLTTAHKTLPFGTQVRVTNAATGRSVVVQINDRGPFIAGRSIDFAAGAARAIGVTGTARVGLAIVR